MAKEIISEKTLSQATKLDELLALDPSPASRLKVLAEEALELSEAAGDLVSGPADEKLRARCLEEIIDVEIAIQLALRSLGVTDLEWSIYGDLYARYKMCRQADRWRRDRISRSEGKA